jgi:Cd2+/Zn2+-exporting ATPase
MLDGIGCACGSCGNDEDNGHDHHDHHHDHDHHKGLSVLDDIGCACGTCSIEHGHESKTKEDTHKVVGIFKEHKALVLSFIVFFVALLAPLDRNLSLGLYLFAYLLVARGVLRDAVKGVVKGRMLDENFLMAVASIVAFIIGEYAEGVAVMLFYGVGQLTEEYAIDRSKGSIAKLLDLKPNFATLKTPFGTKVVSPSSVSVGDIIIVKPGERIPLDGIVANGDSLIDAAMLTGESLPVHASSNSEVYAGTINLNGVLEVKVDKVFSESAVSKILNMVEQANQNKAVTEKFITKFAKIYTPIVVMAAVLIALVPPILLGQAFATWLYRGAIFLVVSCPCALVISVPLGYFGGIGAAARKGVLVKGGQYLETLKSTKIIVFDKTGTLTKGNFKVNQVQVINNLSEAELLRIGAHVEHFSNHPIAKAVAEAYSGTIQIDLVEGIEEVGGRGIKGRFEGQEVLIGNDALMEAYGIGLPDHDVVGTTLYLSCNGQLEGIFHISDEIKERSVEGLKELRALGVEKFVMLTGDRHKIAESVGKQLGIDVIHSELLPGDKLSILESIQEKNDHVVFVGDGINDAPVLAKADVGIAMGSLGSDVAVESSDVVLMTDEITAVADGVKVSSFTSKIIIQNIVMALGIKLMIMLLGTFGYATLWMAIFGDVGVAMMAILNSSRPTYSVK